MAVVGAYLKNLFVRKVTFCMEVELINDSTVQW